MNLAPVAIRAGQDVPIPARHHARAASAASAEQRRDSALRLARELEQGAILLINACAATLMARSRNFWSARS